MDHCPGPCLHGCRQGAIAGAVAFIFRATIISGEGVSLPGIPSTVFVHRLTGFFGRMRGTRIGALD